MLLWSPWTELERVNGEQEEEETEEQKETRLCVFPRSVFPVHMYEDASIEMIWMETATLRLSGTKTETLGEWKLYSQDVTQL